jgi:enoyl-CoA hydratase/carnithine racemase
MAMDDLKLIRVTIDSHIAIVTMDNPPVNAQSRSFTEEMVLAFDRISEMPEVRCAILTGAGHVFSAGADIKARAATAATQAPGDALAHLRRGRESFNAIYDCRKPVIAALNGPALGAGLALAASCDILVAAETASLGLPEVDVGLLGGGRHAMRLFGHSRTRRMMLTGYRVPAPELLRLGVIEACVPLDQLMSSALGLAREIAAKSPVATRLAKHALNAIEWSSLRDGYRFEQEMTAELGRYEDSREAMRAFVEKRPPVFKGA